MPDIRRKTVCFPTRKKLIVSYHEIGHALVAAKQTESAPVHKITIIPRTSGALGYTMQVDEKEHFLMSKEELKQDRHLYRRTCRGRADFPIYYHRRFQ